MYGAVFTWNLLVIGSVRGLIISLIAMGIVLIYRSSRVINFAVGDLGVPSAALLGVMVGATLPAAAPVYSIPSSPYMFSYVNGQRVLVEPTARKIVYVVR